MQTANVKNMYWAVIEGVRTLPRVPSRDIENREHVNSARNIMESVQKHNLHSNF